MNRNQEKYLRIFQNELGDNYTKKDLLALFEEPTPNGDFWVKISNNKTKRKLIPVYRELERNAK